WCYEFGIQICPGCKAVMVAGESSCTCAKCGKECGGLFRGCQDVWDRGSESKNRKGLRTVADPSRSSAGATTPAAPSPVKPVSQPVAQPTVRRPAPAAGASAVRPPGAASVAAPTASGGSRGADFWGIPLEGTARPAAAPGTAAPPSAARSAAGSAPTGASPAPPASGPAPSSPPPSPPQSAPQSGSQSASRSVPPPIPQPIPPPPPAPAPPGSSGSHTGIPAAGVPQAEQRRGGGPPFESSPRPPYPPGWGSGQPEVLVSDSQRFPSFG